MTLKKNLLKKLVGCSYNHCSYSLYFPFCSYNTLVVTTRWYLPSFIRLFTTFIRLLYNFYKTFIRILCDFYTEGTFIRLKLIYEFYRTLIRFFYNRRLIADLYATYIPYYFQFILKINYTLKDENNQVKLYLNLVYIFDLYFFVILIFCFIMNIF